MLKQMIVQEIQDLKQAGYSLNEVIDHLAARPGKTPCRATVRKYYDMDGVVASALELTDEIIAQH